MHLRLEDLLQWDLGKFRSDMLSLAKNVTSSGNPTMKGARTTYDMTREFPCRAPSVDDDDDDGGDDE